MMLRKATIALMACTFLTCATVEVRSEPISTAIGLTAIISSIGVSTAIAGVIGGALISTAISVGASLLANVFASSPGAESPHETARGTTLAVQYGAALPRQAIMGPGAIGGHHVYTNVYGPNNDLLQCVFVIGDGLHGKLTRLWYNGQACTLPENLDENNYAIPEFIKPGDPIPVPITNVVIRYFRGSYDQTADPELYVNANPAGRWTENHRGRGVCYLSITQRYNEEQNLTGVPQLLIETEGLHLYDPRKDSTNGGSGDHRWGIPETCEPSPNPAIQEYNYRRGILINDQRILGMQVRPANLILDMYTVAANVCDEGVPLLGGGEEPRYRASIGIADDRQHSQALDAIRGSMAGYSLERAGQFGPIPGIAQIPISTLAFTDDDLLVGTKAAFSKYRSRSELATAVHGTFAAPDQKWAAVAFPARENPADDTAMGEKLAREIDLTQVYSSSQAQRIAEIERRRSLIQPKGTLTLGSKWIAVQPGDWLPYNSARHGNINIEVLSTSLNADQTVTIGFRQIVSTVFSWTTAGELEGPFLPTAPDHGTLINHVSGFSVEGISIPTTGGLATPAIKCQWQPIQDPSVDDVVIEYRLAGSTDALRFNATIPSFGQAIVAAGVQAASNYEVRATVATTPVREVIWTAWLPTRSGEDHIVPIAIDAHRILEGIDLDNLVPSLRDFVTRVFDETNRQIREITSVIATIAAEHDASTLLNRARDSGVFNEYTQVVEVQFTDVGAALVDANASIEEVRQVGITNEAAIAELTTTVDVRFDVAEATIVTHTLAIADIDSAFGLWETTVTASYGGISGFVSQTLSVAATAATVAARWGVLIDIGGRVSGVQLLGSGTTSAFEIVADIFSVSFPGVTGGSPVNVFQISNVNGTPAIVLRGNIYADGVIITRTVAADQLITNHLVADAVNQVVVASVTAGNWVQPGPHLLASAGITLINGRCLVMCFIDFDALSGVLGFDSYMQLWCDGSAIQGGWAEQSAPSDSATGVNASRVSGCKPLIWSGNAGAGSHTFELYLFPNNQGKPGVGNFTRTTSGTMIVQEVKR